MNILNSFQCSITEEVYDETVIRGMERAHDDAYKINGLIKEGKLKVENIKNNKLVENMLENRTFGVGECSTLHLFHNLYAKVIVTDDRAFLNLLDRNNISYIIPTDLIVRLYELKVITKDESINSLDAIKIYVSGQNYDAARRNLEV
jgi:predicted nucleic acid-binding protein